MSNYRRAWVSGGSYFFTLALDDRRSCLLTEHAALLGSSLAETCRSRPFRVDAIVILPEHLHLVCTLPPGDTAFATRIAQVKAGFSRSLARTEPVNASRLRRRERGIWQRRYWEHVIRDEADLKAHVDYVHFNPVKHGHVACVGQWRWSSFHRYVAQGLLPPDWGSVPDDIHACGEP